MLVTQHPVFKRFWYPVIPIENLEEGVKSFELLGERVALWLKDGQPAAVRDRCCHRSAQLSKGKVIGGNISCQYHGWRFDDGGKCVYVPQLKDSPIPSTYQVQGYHCVEKYGYAWVCLGEPLADIPEIAETKDPNFRLIHEFYEPWKVAGLRVMENELDLAHPTFVHTTTFGSGDHPLPDSMEITETQSGLVSQATLGVVNPPLQQQNLKMDGNQTTRSLVMEWFMPFTCKLQITYPNGLIHVIVNTATPINDSTSQIVQFCLRNDTEADVPAKDVIAFDRAVTLEDKAILETTDYDIPVNLNQEQHMMTDKPGIFMRRRLASLLKSQFSH